MDDEIRFISMIQRYYDVLCFKKVDLEEKALSNINGERRTALDKISTLNDLMLEYDSIFNEFLYKERS